MLLSVPLITVLYSLCSLLIIFMATLIWSRRPAPGSLPLTIFLLISAMWILSSGLEGASTRLTTQDLWAKVTYTFLVFAGVAWLCFTLEYAGSRWHRRPFHLALLCLIPTAVIVFTLAYDFPGTIWNEISFDFAAVNSQTVWMPKIVYLISSGYQYFLYIFGAVVLITLYRRKPRYYWRQITLMLIGTAIPVFSTFIEIMWIIPFSRIDISPIYLLAGSLIYCIAFVRFRFLDILPVAHKTLITHLPDGIIVLNSEGIIHEINPAAGFMMGKDRFSTVNRPLSEVWPQLEKIDRHTGAGLHCEISITTADHPLHLDVSSVELRNQQNYIMGKLIVLRDISELKSTQRSLERLFAKEHDLRRNLEEEMQKRSQYSRAVVHELRTPLTSIIACSDLLKDQVKDSIQLKLVNNIERSSQNLEQRVNELFELARGEMGLLKIEPVRMDMAKLVRDLTAELGPVAAGKGITLKAELQPDSLPMLGDRSRMRQILTNLIGNSLKFTAKGGIIIRARNDNGFILVQIEDSGSGIEAEQMKDLFDPYRRKSREDQTNKGLGLGLALCKIFVELHQGHIWAESTPGHGTTINFTIPALLTSNDETCTRGTP